MGRTRRALALVLLAVVAAAVATLVGATPAGAHAVVISSSPSAEDRLSTPPSEVTIEFSESITSDLGGLTVLDDNGTRVDNDDSSQPTATSLRATLEPDLGDGTYVANYKVVSADGHPVSGAIVFGVGDAQLGDVSGLAASGDPTTELIGTAARWLTYAAGLLAAGLAFFLLFLHDGGNDRRPMASVVQVATIVAAVGALLTVVVQGALATGDGFAAVAQVDVLRGVLREGLGWATAVLLVGLALCHVAVTTRPSAGGRPTVLGQALAFYGGLAVTSSFVFWGHAIEAPQVWISVAADVVHVAVAAVWFGGLVGLTIVLRSRIRAAHAAGLPEPTLLVGSVSPSPAPSPSPLSAAVIDLPPDDDLAPDELAEAGSLAGTVAIVRRFSTAAAVSVAVLAVSGVALAWQELGSLTAVTTTSYGRTLLVKLALVVVIVVFAAYNRFLLLPWLLTDGSDEPSPAEPTPGATDPETDAADEPDPALVDEGVEAGWRTLVRTVAAEALILLAVLAVTAVLVNEVPGRTEAVIAPSGPFVETVAFRDGKVSLTVTPNQPGVNSFHVNFLDADGRPADLAQKVILELRLPAKDIGPIEREMIKAGSGHFLLEGISDLSIAGDWEITLNVRVSDFDQERVTFRDTIG